MEEETIGLGFHSHHRDAITGVVAPMSTEAAASSIIDKQHQHVATTRFVSSSENSKLMSMFPPPPPHPSAVHAQQQQSIKANDRGIPLHSTQTCGPQEMHQNVFPKSTFQPPPGLPPQLSIPPSMAVPPPSQFPPPPPQQQQIQSQIIQQQQQQQNDSIAKARAIAQRFHTESTQTPSYTSSSSSINNLHSNSNRFNHNNNTNINDINTHNYAQKRQQHFQNEKLKLQSATLKNLEYIMKHEESQLRSHVECMNEMTEWEERQELQLMRRQQQKQKQQQQRQVEQRSGGGIGSKDQRYVERVRKRQQMEHLTTDGCSSSNASGYTAGANQQQQQQQKRTSIYLTNLPTDGSITERTLRSLFCVYGRLDRVTMYRNRSTGELKGDGLVVFGLDAVGGNGIGSSGTINNLDVATNNTSGGGSGVDLVETVCMQMNGAELPCGTVIGVEPADMDWGRKDKKVKMMDCDHVQLHQQQPQVATTNSGGVEEVKQSNEASTKDEEEEDLDDFFASLE